jgi:DNA-directed RNA polymerase II subunit RPB2
MEQPIPFIFDTSDDLKSYLYDDLANTTVEVKEGGASININATTGAPVKKVQMEKKSPEAPMAVDKELNVDHLMALLIAEYKNNGPGGDHIRSMNTFYSVGIKQIVKDLFQIKVDYFENKRNKNDEDKAIDHFSYYVEFTDVKLGLPTTPNYRTQNEEKLTPNMARLSNLTYSSNVYISAKVTLKAHLKNGKVKERTHSVNDMMIAKLPVMVKSKKCHLYGQPPEILRKMGEDPKDPGGYFIIKGGEWVIDKLENLILNKAHAYKNSFKKELVRITFQSKPGDYYENSYYMILRYLNDGQITIELTINKFRLVEIPFYLIFRAFGMVRDDQIVNHIVYGLDNNDPISTNMYNILDKAFVVENKEFKDIQNVTDPDIVGAFIASKLNDLAKDSNYKRDENSTKYINNTTYNFLDKYILPHVGEGPRSRIRKLRFLGHLIRLLLLTEMRINEPTDRDSYESKRIHSAGECLAKAFKSSYNLSIVQEIKKNITKYLLNTSFSQIQLDSIFRVGDRDLEQAIIKCIVTGEKKITVKRKEVSNKISSQQLYHKNDLNVISTLNSITTHGSSSAKSSDRGTDMRMPHPTYVGFIGLSQSADTGEKVGMTKQMTISAFICEASSGYILKEALFRDADTIDLDDIPDPADIIRLKLTKIFVNGEWIGFCTHGHEYVKKYKTARRYGEINRFVTIVQKITLREIYFWTDAGRMMRPLLIVYNDIDEFKAKSREGKDIEFVQWIKMTKEHIDKLRKGIIGLGDLVKERIIEYIAPEEQQNCYLAQTYDELIKDRHNFTKQYTHCDTSQAIMSIIEMSSTNTNHVSSNRITMFTNQKKQTLGWPVSNLGEVIAKNMYVQYYCNWPTVGTIVNRLGTVPNNQNVVIAYTSLTGFGQEDSLIVNKSTIDRGLFNAVKYYYEITELDNGEQFGNPAPELTLDRKSANYDYCGSDGLIKEGTVIQKNYVLIQKVARIDDPANPKFKYVDRSIVYKDEPAIVDKVVPGRNSDGQKIAKVSIIMQRTAGIGDKASSHSGCKGIIGLVLPSTDMPFTEDGLIPDLIINEQSIPTRMVIGQIIETTMAEYGAKKGCILDASPFKALDIEGTINELHDKYGIQYGGHRRLYNGQYGNWLDTKIFIGLNAYQRLQKFVLDESYAMTNGPTVALTKQPVDGKANNGGLRIGEMETDTILSHGAIRYLCQKLYEDSDGFDRYICRVCGNEAIVSHSSNIYKCKFCGDNADIVNIPSCVVSNVLFKETATMGIKTTFELEPYTFERYEK